MTGLASGSDMHVVLPDRGRRWRLAAHATPRGCLGTYRFERAYDCTRTLERVHVYRWRPSGARDERRVSDAPR